MSIIIKKIKSNLLISGTPTKIGRDEEVALAGHIEGFINDMSKKGGHETKFELEVINDEKKLTADDEIPWGQIYNINDIEYEVMLDALMYGLARVVGKRIVYLTEEEHDKESKIRETKSKSQKVLEDVDREERVMNYDEEEVKKAEKK